MPMPAASASRAERKRTSLPSSLIVPSIVGVHAGDDLHQRRLAGAVLADEAVDLAARGGAKSTSRSAMHAAEVLGDACQFEQRLAGRAPERSAARRRSDRRGRPEAPAQIRK